MPLKPGSEASHVLPERGASFFARSRNLPRWTGIFQIRRQGDARHVSCSKRPSLRQVARRHMNIDSESGEISQEVRAA